MSANVDQRDQTQKEPSGCSASSPSLSKRIQIEKEFLEKRLNKIKEFEEYVKQTPNADEFFDKIVEHILQ